MNLGLYEVSSLLEVVHTDIAHVFIMHVSKSVLFKLRNLKCKMNTNILLTHILFFNIIKFCSHNLCP